MITASATIISALIAKYGLPIPFVYKRIKLNGEIKPLYFIDSMGVKTNYNGLVLTQEITNVILTIIGANAFCRGIFLMKDNKEIKFNGKLKAKGKVDKDVVFLVYTVNDSEKGEFTGVASINFNAWDKPTSFYNAKSYVDKNKIVFGKIDIQLLESK